MRIYKRLILLLLLITVFESASYSQTRQLSSLVHIDSSRIAVKLQERKDYSFNRGTIGFSNKFSSARYNGVSQLNDSTFIVTIEPESERINPSPWYAFKVWSKDPKNIYIQLHYPIAKHRYKPKLSTDGENWQEVGEIFINADRSGASFKIPVSKDTLTVAAQEIKTIAETYHWADQLARLSYVEKKLIGYSILNKPIYALNTKNSQDKKMVVVMGRQHPPEITGYMAMKHFVEELLSDTKQAEEFRKEYELVIIPMLNPDGIEEGHWRHSMAGVDLNRDWLNFRQPESSAVKEYLTHKIEKQDAKLYFALDFHSTDFDILYTNEDDSLNHRSGLMRDWIKAIQNKIPQNKLKVQSSSQKKYVSKSWFYRVFKAEAVTYEIGDKTSREFLKRKSVVAAEELMKLLLDDRR